MILARCLIAALIAATAFAAPSSSLAEGSVLDRIKETGEITLGVRRDARPHSYIDEQGRAQGYSVEVCAQVVGRLRAQLGLTQLSMRVEPVDASDRFDAVA